MHIKFEITRGDKTRAIDLRIWERKSAAAQARDGFLAAVGATGLRASDTTRTDHGPCARY